MSRKRFTVESNSGMPVEIPTGLRVPDTTARLQAMIRHELFRQQIDNSAETFEEADDFDFDDDEEWHSPYEVDFDPVEPGVDVPSETKPKVPEATVTTPPATTVASETGGGGVSA